MPQFRNVTFGYIAGILSFALMVLSLFAPESLRGVAGLAQMAVYWTAVIYFFMVIHRIHKILRAATDPKYPISPARAVGFCFIPFYNIYWMFKWPGEIALFLNHITRQDLLKKNRWGWLFLLASVVSGVLSGPSLILNFFILNQIQDRMMGALPSAQLPIQDYDKSRYKSSIGVVLVLLFVGIAIVGLLAAIAIPNFMLARQHALERQQPQTQNAISNP